MGAIGLRRGDARLFRDRQVGLVEVFAGQAVIAIENVRLFNETKESLERQTATGNVLDVISRSAFDIGPVLRTIAESSLALCRADHAVVWQRDGDEWFYDATAGDWPAAATSRGVRRRWEADAVRTGSTASAVQRPHTVHVPDTLHAALLRSTPDAAAT